MGDFSIKAKFIKENHIGWAVKMQRYWTGYYLKPVILTQILFCIEKHQGGQNNSFIISELENHGEDRRTNRR